MLILVSVLVSVSFGVGVRVSVRVSVGVGAPPPPPPRGGRAGLGNIRPAKLGVLPGSVAGSKCKGENYTGREVVSVLIVAQVSTVTP